MKKKIINYSAAALYFSTPFESVAILPGFSVVKLMTIFFGLVVFNYLRGIPKNRSVFLNLFLLYTVLTIISVLWSISKVDTIKYSIGTILPSFIITSFLFFIVKTKADVEILIKGYAYGSLFISIYAFYLFIIGFRFADSIDESRLTVLGQDQNELSFLLCWGIVSFMYLLKNYKTNLMNKLYLYLIIGFISFIVLSTGSRTGFVILISTFILFLLSNFGFKTLVLVIPFFILSYILFFNFLPEQISDRLFETGDQIKNKNLTNRVDIWLLGLNAFYEEGALLLGIGFKGFRSMMDNYYDISKPPHNTYISTLVELGVVGLVVFILMIVNLIRNVYHLVKNESIFYINFLLPLLLAMTTLGTENRRWMFLLAVIIIKLSLFSNKVKHEER